MRIARVDLWHVAVPLPAPFRPAWIPGMAQRENRFDLLRLVTDDGVEGWTAAPAMGEERAGLGDLLGPYLLGERADDIPSVRQRIREMGYLGWRVGWIEPACWDILGKVRGKPVWRLLGGDGPAPVVRLYASMGEVNDDARDAEAAAARLGEGFAGVKLRVHAATLEEDVARLRAVRAAIGDRATLMVDANQGWRVAVIADAPRWDLARAEAFCRAAADVGCAWVEEPLPHDAYDDLVRLRAALGGRVAVAGGELNGQGLPDFGVMLEKGCLDVYQPDAVFTGGIASTWSIVRRVAAAGARYSPHTWTNGVGFAVNLQLFAASPFAGSALLEYPLAPPGWVPEARDGLLVEPWRHDRGALALPERPGLGVEIDPGALRRHGRRAFTATPVRVAMRAAWSRGIGPARELGDVRSARLAARSQAIEGADPVAAALDDAR